MGGIKKAASSVTNLFSAPKPPDPPPLPEPTLMEDPQQIEAARRRKIAEQRKRSGVASTQLTNQQTTSLFGSG